MLGKSLYRLLYAPWAAGTANINKYSSSVGYYLLKDPGLNSVAAVELIGGKRARRKI